MKKKKSYTWIWIISIIVVLLIISISAYFILKVEPEHCQSNFKCSDWGLCTNSQQTRTCTVVNDCPVNESTRPKEIQSCNDLCTPNWVCTDWDICMAGNQIRTCTDNSNCGINSSKPSESQTCSNPGNCTPNWEISTDWMPCDNGDSIRVMRDTNSCDCNDPCLKVEHRSC